MPSTRSKPPITKPKTTDGRQRLSLSVQYAHAAEPIPSRAQFRRWVNAALAPLAPFRGRGVAGEGKRVSVTLRLVDNEEGRALNRDFRGKDYATNVLTFAYGEEANSAEMSLSGDIILCAPVVKDEAKQQGKALLAHYAHLTVHGMLHLQGYDHETDQEAVIMEANETAILAKLGFSDPYAADK
ncbi:MAG TPA: rRNA maturation RNase YbeY [Thiobacillaceae bacterium]|nr:rRNA maturation RNase YbeY [Thiobacillaceae bacterium]